MTAKLSCIKRSLIFAVKKKTDCSVLEDGYNIIKCSINHIPQLSRIYREVFSSYPFPVCEEEYLEKTMNENVDYYAVEKDGEIVAVSSAEKDIEHGNAEMTDLQLLQNTEEKDFLSCFFSKWK